MNLNLAIVGASGLVGQTILKILEERAIKIDSIDFFASKKSAGQAIDFNNETYYIKALTLENIGSYDVAFFAVSGALAKAYVPKFVEKGSLVIDNSSYFRMNDHVPLIIPEVNDEQVFLHQGIIANPNCSTIQAVLALKAIDDLFDLKRVVYSTYQAVSGSGTAGIESLRNKEQGIYPYSIHHNILPEIDDFLDNGYTKEEMKMMNETKKILGNEGLSVTATTVRVPIENTHAVSMNVETKNKVDLEDLKESYRHFESIVLDDSYSVAEAVNGSDQVYIGRLRLDSSVDYGLNLWTVADNIRKGAAGNSVDILELCLKKGVL